MDRCILKMCSVTISLLLCAGIFAQPKVNPENMSKMPTQAGVEFTDLSFMKGVDVTAEKNVTKAPVKREVVKSRTVVLSEDFSDYTAGGKIAEQALALGRDYWITWSDMPGTDEDGDIIEFEGNKVGSWSYGADQLLLLGDKSAGIWELAFKMYVPAGNEGYFNVLSAFDGIGVPPGTFWALQVYFNENGTNPGDGKLYAGGYAVPFTFTHNTWVNVRVVISLDNDWAKFYINGALVFGWQYSSGGCPKIISAMDIFPPTEGIANFYIDDIEFSLLPNPEFTSENFSDYTAGGKIAEQALALGRDYWTTWSDMPGSDEDGDVIEFEGDNVGSWSYGADQILLLGEKNEGVWELSFKIYIPEGKEGYFNVLGAFDGTGSAPGTVWAMQVFFNEGGVSPGNGKIYAGRLLPASFTFSHNTWLDVKIYIDLDDNIAKLRINDDLKHQWAYTAGTFGKGCPKVIYGFNIYPPTPDIANFYIDDIIFNVAVKEEYPGVAGVGTFDVGTLTGTGDGWAYIAPFHNILDGSDVTITGVAVPESNIEIIISENANTNVTLNNVSIYKTQYTDTPNINESECPIYLNHGATLNLTLIGENILRSGDYLPAISISEGRTIIIDGDGSLSATGGWQCAGIGGGWGYYGPCGTITINSGTIFARGANSSWGGTTGAGIGSGAVYPNGDITINGGSVVAFSGNESGKGIGNGGADYIGTLTITGNPIIFTNSVADMNPEIKTGGILVARNSTHWYADDNFTLEYNTVVPNVSPFACLFTIGEGKTLTIPAGITLTNNSVIVNHSQIIVNGTLINNGSIQNVGAGTIVGTVEGNAPTNVTLAGNNIDLSVSTPPNAGEGWTYLNNFYCISDGANVTVTGNNAGLRRLEVAGSATANVTLNNATITGISGTTTYVSPFMVNYAADVNLTIEGENNLSAVRCRAGIQVPEGSSITIDGTGSLSALGGQWGGAGIGGAINENGGKVTINGGTITAMDFDTQESYCPGAGIGGGGAGIWGFSFYGQGGWGGDVTINGGHVTALSRQGGAGIGGGGASTEGGTLTMQYDGVAFVSSLETFNETRTDITGVVNGVLFDGLEGFVYGTSVSLTTDVLVPAEYVLTVPNGVTLRIPEGKTLKVSGTVINNGTIIKCGEIIGTINNNQPLPCDNTYTVTFNVFNDTTLEPILGAVIIFDGEELEGYEVVVLEGEYEYSVIYPDYDTVHGVRFINESITIDVPMTFNSISGNSMGNVVLYPNPFIDEINIGNSSLVKSVVITNATGQNVKTANFDGKSISTKGLSSGIYFVILESHNGEKVVKKMIKK